MEATKIVETRCWGCGGGGVCGGDTIELKKQFFDISGSNEFSTLDCKRKLSHIQNTEALPVSFTVFFGTSKDRREWKERESQKGLQIYKSPGVWENDGKHAGI